MTFALHPNFRLHVPCFSESSPGERIRDLAYAWRHRIIIVMMIPMHVIPSIGPRTAARNRRMRRDLTEESTVSVLQPIRVNAAPALAMPSAHLTIKAWNSIFVPRSRGEITRTWGPSDMVELKYAWVIFPGTGLASLKLPTWVPSTLKLHSPLAIRRRTRTALPAISWFRKGGSSPGLLVQRTCERDGDISGGGRGRSIARRAHALELRCRFLAVLHRRVSVIDRVLEAVDRETYLRTGEMPEEMATTSVCAIYMCACCTPDDSGGTCILEQTKSFISLYSRSASGPITDPAIKGTSGPWSTVTLVFRRRSR
ncbi:hypothetical protein B0H15DRAFT_379526 [Mycena belliarum]|uniref:Uncharacterized protein n=1 Tax=Mycena belliarum TaxID=1033014 RepID=A0AAD6XT04_9AGAR|nr:hypothetical protein B0H15DRAFT_379526 [Mycena belliae]